MAGIAMRGSMAPIATPIPNPKAPITIALELRSIRGVVNRDASAAQSCAFRVRAPARFFSEGVVGRLGREGVRALDVLEDGRFVLAALSSVSSSAGFSIFQLLL